MPTDRKVPNFNRNGVFWLAGAFAVGVLAANFVGVDLRVAVIGAAIFAVLAFVLQTQQFATLLILAAFACAGAASMEVERDGVSANRLRTLYDNGIIRSGDAVEVEGVMVAGREPSVDGDFVTLRAEKLRYRGDDIPVSGNVRLFVPNSA